jgi:hypothetical protein
VVENSPICKLPQGYAPPPPGGAPPPPPGDQPPPPPDGGAPPDPAQMAQAAAGAPAIGTDAASMDAYASYWCVYLDKNATFAHKPTGLPMVMT